MIKFAMIMFSLFSMAAFADESVETTTSTEVENEYVSTSIVAEGVTFSLTKDFTKVTTKVGSFSDKEDADHLVGFNLGLNYIKLQNIGVSARLGLHLYSGDNIDDARLIKAEINATYGFSRQVYGYVGPNISFFSIDEDEFRREIGFDADIDSDFGLGFQLGLGVQLNNNFGLQIGYVRNKSTVNVKGSLSGSVFSEDIDFSFAGPELSLIVTL